MTYLRADFYPRLPLAVPTTMPMPMPMPVVKPARLAPTRTMPTRVQTLVQQGRPAALQVAVQLARKEVILIPTQVQVSPRLPTPTPTIPVLNPPPLQPHPKAVLPPTTITLVINPPLHPLPKATLPPQAPKEKASQDNVITKDLRELIRLRTQRTTAPLQTRPPPLASAPPPPATLSAG